jgi:hypothetical protein
MDTVQVLRRGAGTGIARIKRGDEKGVAHGYPKFCVLILNITEPNKITQALYVRPDMSHKPTLRYVQ